MIQMLLFVAAGGRCADSSAALLEMQSITQGLTWCALDTLYYVVPESLNDSGFPDQTPFYDYISYGGGCHVIRPEEGRFRPSRIDLVTAVNSWRGPYLTYQPGRTQTGTVPYDQGSPLDPWGSPYYLFSPLGLMRGDSGSVTLELYGDQFDGYTLVSLGADEVLSSDDVFLVFGPSVTAFALSSLRGSSVVPPAGRCVSRDASSGWQAVAGSLVTLRGLNLGAAQAGARVMHGGREFADVRRWSSREIDVVVPADAEGTGTLTVERLPYATNGLFLAVVGQPAGAWQDWMSVE